jgi:hypothetical protein
VPVFGVGRVIQDGASADVRYFEKNFGMGDRAESPSVKVSRASGVLSLEKSSK